MLLRADFANRTQATSVERLIYEVFPCFQYAP